MTTALPRLYRVLVRMLFVVVLLIAAFAAMVFFAQDSLIYHPRRYADGFESMLPPGTSRLEYTTDAGKQLAFYLPPRSGAAVPRRVWVAFSGNASVALDWLDLAESYPGNADAFLLIDYPGYGRSEGRASISRTRASADRAVQLIGERLNITEADLSSRLSVLGLSLGSAAALEFAAGHPIERAVLIAPFTTMREEAATLFGRPISYLLRENYDNSSRLAELAKRTPPPRVGIFHGTADTLIPVRMGRELAESAPAIAEFFPIEGATHDTIFGSAVDEIILWMSRE